MGNNSSNFPQAKMTREIQSADGFVKDTVSCITELAQFGKPKDEEELKQRIKQYFDFCADSGFRPCVESLALSLGVDRTTFWRWCNQDIRVSDEWSNTCKKARQAIIAFIESSAISGHLSPPIAIFALKNLANWKDTISFEDATPKDLSGHRYSVDDIPLFDEITGEWEQKNEL